MRHTITRESLTEADACWGPERIEAMVPPDGTVVSAASAQAALDSGVSATDLHWSLVHAAGASDTILRQHACWCARQALALVAVHDQRSIAAIEVAERYAVGDATAGELRAARAAAWDARDAAWVARYAACDAASDAACDAACDAAYAACDAASDAASDAAYAAAWDARAAARAAAYAAASAAYAAASATARAAQCIDLASRMETP